MILDTLNPQVFPQCLQEAVAPTLFAMWPHRIADGYESQLRIVPDHENRAVAPSSTYEGRVTVPDGTYLWAISASSAQAAGFDMQIRDVGIQEELFGTRVYYQNAAAQPAPGDFIYTRQTLLTKPLLFLDPAQMLVQVWNRATVANVIQVVLWLMAPAKEENAK